MLQKWMNEAVALSVTGGEREGCRPFGAVIACGDAVIGRGISSTRLLKDPTAHAEILAIREAAKVAGSSLLKGCVLICSSEPCAMCLAAAYNACIERIYFGCSREEVALRGYRDLEIHDEISKPWADRKMSFLQLGADEARKVLDAFPLEPQK